MAVQLILLEHVDAQKNGQLVMLQQYFILHFVLIAQIALRLIEQIN